MQTSSPTAGRFPQRILRLLATMKLYVDTFCATAMELQVSFACTVYMEVQVEDDVVVELVLDAEALPVRVAVEVAVALVFKAYAVGDVQA